MQNLSRIETMERAREVLLGMGEDQEITVELDEWEASVRKHNDQEYSASFPEQETGTISLLDASHILLEYGDYDLYLS
jgi:dsDNA-specific endonuclease/ATPase MutS2